MTRLPDWRARLFAYMASVRREPFAYGRFDCCLFAAGAIDAQTGGDLVGLYRGRYDTRETGLALIGKGGFIRMASELLRPIPLARASVGDIAIAPVEEGLACCVYQGDTIALVAAAGLVTADRAIARKAFTI